MSMLSKNVETPSCPVSQIRKLYNKTLQLEENSSISLEMVLTICFPSVWENIQRALSDNYTQGYLAGLKEKGIEN